MMHHKHRRNFGFSAGKHDDDLARQLQHTAVVANFYDIFEAQMAASRLRAAGIHCFLANENTATVMPHLPTAIRLHVRHADEWQAREILQEFFPHKMKNQPEGERFSNGMWIVFALIIGIILAILMLAAHEVLPPTPTSK